MGDFKINKNAQEEPKYCDYIQEKIDIAKQNNATYVLDDEDKRIQALYNQQDLTTRDNIKSLDRILSQGDGKEYLVVNKNVEFYIEQPTPDGQVVSVYKDSYSTNEGIVNLPIRSVNEDGVEHTNQTRIVYTIPFSAGKVDEYIRKAGGKPVTFRFYEGAVTSNRLPTTIPRVGNRDFFVNASWTELQYGKEKKVLDSMINRLPDVRKELKSEGDNNNSGTNTQDTYKSSTEERVVTSSEERQGREQQQTGGGSGKTTTTTTVEALNSNTKKSNK